MGESKYEWSFCWRFVTFLPKPWCSIKSSTTGIILAIYFCLDKGVSISRRIPTEAHIPRTHVDIQRCAQEAETTGRTIHGIKGISILAEYTDLVNGIPIDYMHAVLEGIMKALMTYWFEPPYSGKSFSLSRHLKEIDRSFCEAPTWISSFSSPNINQ